MFRFLFRFACFFVVFVFVSLDRVIRPLPDRLTCHPRSSPATCLRVSRTSLRMLEALRVDGPQEGRVVANLERAPSDPGLNCRGNKSQPLDRQGCMSTSTAPAVPKGHGPCHRPNCHRHRLGAACLTTHVVLHEEQDGLLLPLVRLLLARLRSTFHTHS